jgi:predicted DNA-binding protein
MSIQDASGPAKNGGIKTLAIRLEPDLHQQLSLIAQLQNSTITDEIRTAIEERITRLKDQPEIAAKADEVLVAIEAEAAARRDAIATLFGSDSATTDQKAAESSSRPRARKRTSSSEGGAPA